MSPFSLVHSDLNNSKLSAGHQQERLEARAEGLLCQGGQDISLNDQWIFCAPGEILGEGGPEQQPDQLHRGGNFPQPRPLEDSRSFQQQVRSNLNRN